MSGEAAQQKITLEQSETAGFAPIDETGKPMIQISCAATELIPTIQYGNCTVGPIVVKRWIRDTDNDIDLKNEITKTQSLCEEAVAEDRQSVHALTRQSAGGRISS